jgi:ribonucleoside-triphosphate reductase
VLTINLNRCVQYAVNHKLDYCEYLSQVIDLCHKVQSAYNENLKELQAHGMLPLFDAGYINIDRQYLTIVINGLVEAAEFMGHQINDNPEYLKFVSRPSSDLWRSTTAVPHQRGDVQLRDNSGRERGCEAC